MKTRIIKCASILALLLAAQSAFAYEDEKVEETCKKPKFTDFTLKEYIEPEKAEVPPEAAFEFKVSAWSNPDTIRLTGKGEKIPFKVESNSSFHRVKAKLPASLNGKFVRINASVKAVLGCEEKEGWLVKVAGRASPAPAPAETKPQNAEPSPQTEAPAVSPALENTTPAGTAESAKPTEPAPQ